MLQEVTGELPAETPLSPGEPVPQVRRRVGTSFCLSPKIINRDSPTQVKKQGTTLRTVLIPGASKTWVRASNFLINIMIVVNILFRHFWCLG